MSYLGLNIGTR